MYQKTTKTKIMIRITLTNGSKISGVTLVDKLLENGSRFTIAVKGSRIFEIESRDADGIYWKEIK